MSRIRLEVLLCVPILLCGQLAYSGEEADKKLDKAKQLIDSGKPAAARTILRDVIRHNPNNADAHMQLGAALAAVSEKDDYGDAIAEEKKAIELDPNSFGARRILGMIYANQRKYEDAIALLQEACKLNPSSFASQRDLGKAYLAAGKTDDAILAWQKGLEINPKNIPLHTNLAMIFSQKEKYTDAIREAAQAVKLNESRAESHLLLGNIKLESGDAAGSIESFKTAIELNGYDSFGCKNPLVAAGALSGLGWAMVSANGDNPAILEEAVSYQRRAIKADNRFLPAYFRLAESLGKQHKSKDAEAFYKRIFASSEYSVPVGLSYARFLVSDKREEEARAVLKKVLEKSPQNKQASSALEALNK